jgi:hypothetical protein
MDWPTWLTSQVKTPEYSSQGWKNFSTSSMKTTLRTESSQTTRLNFQLETTRRMHSPNIPTITSNHTTSFSSIRSLKQQLQKTFVNCCRIRIKPASPSTMLIKHSSQSIELDRTSASPQLVSMPWKPIRIRTPQLKIPMSLHSGHNSSNLALSLPDTTTVAISPEDKAPTGETPTTDKPRIKAPMHPEMANFVFTARL